MRKYLILLFIVSSVISYNSLSACTSVIISGKSTADGRPIMWKHRDTSSENNKLLYFTGKRYDYLGMVSAGKNERKSVWMGMNSAGFCIMNTKSYNINEEDEKGHYGNGSIMAMALASCETLADFENLLDTLIQPMGLSSNYGVIDAKGGAAYYEVGDYHWVKMDVNDQRQAPLGYIIRTNHSFTGDPASGEGYVRYITASGIFYRNAMEGDLTVESILREAERSLVNGFTGDDLLDFATSSDDVRMVHFKDNIARKSSTSSSVFKGVKPGEDPMSTVMWNVTGWPLATVAYPVWMNDDHFIPSILTAGYKENSAICDAGLRAKSAAMPIVYGHGQDYININKVYNTDNTGYLQWIRPLEEEIFRLTDKHRSDWDNSVPDMNELKSLYSSIDKMIKEVYKKNGFTLNSDHK